MAVTTQVVRLTIREVAESIRRQYGGKLVPDWKLRRVVDSLDAAERISVQRIHVYRTVADSDVEIIAEELRRLNWIKAVDPVAQ